MQKRIWGIALSIALIFCGSAVAGHAAPGAKQYFSGPCAFDNKAGKDWLGIQGHYMNLNECVGPLRVVPVSLTKSRPKAKLSASEIFRPIENCKIKNPDNNVKGFLNANQADFKLFPGPNTVIQIVPIAAPDTPVSKGSTPSKDYGRYFKFLTDYYHYASDGGSKFEIRVPKTYFSFSKPLIPYNITHHTDEQQAQKQNSLGPEIISEMAGKIDFTGVDLALVVVPAGTSAKNLEQGSLGGTTLGNSKFLRISMAQPYTLGEQITKNRIMMLPMWWMHELYHIGAGLMDHNGNNFWQNGYGTDDSQPGMGNWGLMSMSKTEMTTWEKWILGMTTDSQVYCLPANTSSTTWITPTGVKSTQHKLSVIQVSDSKVIVIESRRAAGLDYLLPRESEGALVYEIDLAQREREYGYRVISNRPISRSQPFLYSSAPLKRGEILVSNGLKITNIESGEFGDVIKVEPVK